MVAGTNGDCDILYKENEDAKHQITLKSFKHAIIMMIFQHSYTSLFLLSRRISSWYFAYTSL